MVFARQFSVGFTNLIVSGTFADSQYFVIIAFTHRVTSSTDHKAFGSIPQKEKSHVKAEPRQ
jgi:hypothetical protein